MPVSSVLGAKARAVLQGRYFVSHEDIQAVALPVLRHRIKTNFNADAEGLTSDKIIAQLLKTTAVVEEDPARGRLPKVFKSADAG